MKFKINRLFIIFNAFQIKCFIQSNLGITKKVFHNISVEFIHVIYFHATVYEQT